MNGLTYSVIYTPSTHTDYNAKYVCSDGKVHIRFRDYNKTQIIEGFEGKLTYLITFLFNRNKCSNIAEFMTLNETWILNQYLEKGISEYTYNYYKYKGLKLFEKYSKKDSSGGFGDYNISCFPQENIKFDNATTINNIDIFIKDLKIQDLNEFLFDDGYSIIIHKKKNDKDNKFIRKQKKRLKTESDLIELW